MSETSTPSPGPHDDAALERRRRDRRRVAARRARRRRGGLLGAAAVLACGVALALALGSGQSSPARTTADHASAHGLRAPAGPRAREASMGRRATSSSAAVSGAAGARGAASAAGLPPAPARHGPPPGALPQTNRLPSAHTARFRSEMAALWRAITTGRWREGVPAFFPKGAYLQVKAIAGAGEDFDNRLLGGFRLDIGAAHALLGASAAGAQLLGVRVPSRYGHWVTPGVCYNRTGYWEVPNSRVVYRERGAVRSFGIASMISWRGVWYVVHLGAVLRPSEHGYLDSPSAGPGVSEYSSTC